MAERISAVSVGLVDRLLYEAEGDSLDFKREQYRFVRATKDDKSELLKDILAFANSWRRSDAYILIGVVEKPGGQATLQGIASQLDDAKLQQFVNSKVQRPIHFAYVPMDVRGTPIAVIHIPLQERPFFLRKPYGKLEADVVYVRRGSSTDRALPDEIARMGRSSNSVDSVSLDVFFADPRHRVEVSPTVLSHILTVPPKDELPDYVLPGPAHIANLTGRSANRDYYRKLARYTWLDRLVSPIWLAIRNQGGATAHDVRIEARVSGADGSVLVLDDYDYPEVPEAETMMYDIFGRNQRPFVPPDVRVARVGNEWSITMQADKVQPKSTEWFADPFYLGAMADGEVQLRVQVFADNLSSPHQQVLSLPVAISSEAVDLERIRELERDRFVSSPEHQAFLRDQGLDSDGENGD